MNFVGFASPITRTFGPLGIRRMTASVRIIGNGWERGGHKIIICRFADGWLSPIFLSTTKGIQGNPLFQNMYNW